MKKLIFAATFVLLVFINLDKSYSQKLRGEDDRIIITVDSIERHDSYPEMLRESTIGDQMVTYLPPSKSNDFVLINITVVKKRDLKIRDGEFRISNTQVIDDKGKTHKVLTERLGISINITFPDKNPGYLLFEMSKDATPVQLKYYYQYREEPPESQKIKIGQIDIML